MEKKQKILIFLLLILLALIAYLILTSESVKPTAPAAKSQPAEQEKAARLEADYQSGVKPIFADYGKLDGENNITADKIAELKNRLLALKVPAKFKELHIRLVQILDGMQDYLSQNNQKMKNQSSQIFNQLKADYSWLNP